MSIHASTLFSVRIFYPPCPPNRSLSKRGLLPHKNFVFTGAPNLPPLKLPQGGMGREVYRGNTSVGWVLGGKKNLGRVKDNSPPLKKGDFLL
jgi:hypothetical protein